MATKVQALMSVVLGLGATGMAGLAAHSAVTASNTQYTGVLQAATVTPLNFQSQGYVTNVEVQPGQFVRQGTVLATESSSLLQSQLLSQQTVLDDDRSTEEADQGAVTADEARVKADSDPTVANLQQQEATLEVSKAETQLEEAQTNAAAASTLAQKSVDQASTLLQADTSRLSTDTQNFEQQCPTDPPPAYEAAKCSKLQAQITTDQTDVIAQQGSLSVVQAENDKTSNQNASSVALAQISLEEAQTRLSAPAASSNPAQVADDQASLARDQAQVQRDAASVNRDEQSIASTQVAMSELKITAPSDGVVLSVGGSVGVLADASGVRQAQSQTIANYQSQSSGLFSFLPPTPQSSRATSSTSGQSPMIEMRSAVGWQVVVRVPETSLGRFTAGRKAVVDIPSTNLNDIPATVGSVDQIPVISQGAVYYDVVVSVPGNLPNAVLSGMTADVHLS